jgi:hypothetical protein
VTSASPGVAPPPSSSRQETTEQADGNTPRVKRRVSDPNSGSGSGPLIDRTGETPSSSGGWPRAGVEQGAQTAPPLSPSTQPQQPPTEKKGGWPRAK